jgi:hypothetical protein
MVNIDVLTMGCELKDAQGDIYRVTDNVSTGNKILIELQKQAVVAPAEDLIPEV